MKNNKKLILLVSGKRWSGKDYFCDQAIAYFHTSHLYRCIKVAHSDIVKTHYCQQTGINLAKLLADRTYKEAHRNKMIAFAEHLQASDPTVLSQLVTAKINQKQFNDVELVCISDFRRKFEQSFFEQAFGKANVLTLRIFASNENRKNRGWEYDSIKDQRNTECDLDDKQDWDLIFHNDGTKEDVADWVQNDLANHLSGIFLARKQKEVC